MVCGNIRPARCSGAGLSGSNFVLVVISIGSNVVFNEIPNGLVNSTLQIQTNILDTVLIANNSIDISILYR